MPFEGWHITGKTVSFCKSIEDAETNLGIIEQINLIIKSTGELKSPTRKSWSDKDRAQTDNINTMRETNFNLPNRTRFKKFKTIISP